MTLHKTIQEHIQAIQQLETVCGDDIRQAADLCQDALEGGNKLFFCGNGGSAADCQHLAAELVVRFTRERQGLSAIALTTDTSILTACGNDYGYERVFARQVQALGKIGDVLFAFSTSGNSDNVLAAVREAHEQGMFTIGFTGGDGGELAQLCEICINVPSEVTARIQECHILLGHWLCDELERRCGDVSA